MLGKHIVMVGSGWIWIRNVSIRGFLPSAVLTFASTARELLTISLHKK